MLSKKLRAIRQEIIASGIPLLTAEEVAKEKAERRGAGCLTHLCQSYIFRRNWIL